MKRLILSLICFLVTPIQLMFAAHYPVDIFAHLQERKDASIIWIDQEKAYLNAERVFVTEQGISLTTDLFGPLLLSNLHQNDKGLYTEIMNGALNYACLGEVSSLSIPVNHK